MNSKLKFYSTDSNELIDFIRVDRISDMYEQLLNNIKNTSFYHR